jgi:hypothetical protein
MSRSSARVAVALLLLTMTVAKSARAQAKDSVSTLSGCFALEVGRWSRPVANAGVPDTIRLDTARTFVTEQPSEWRVLLPAGYARNAFWMPASQYAVRLIWKREFGIQIRATIEGPSLQGVAYGSMDELSTPAPTATVKGHRIDCPASLE